MAYSVSSSFLLYLNEEAPSLFWQLPLDDLSFRWKIPKEECLGGWTSPKSGIDIMRELRTDEICGFTGIHFPGKEFLYGLVKKSPGPYDVLSVVDSINHFLLENNESFGEYYELVREKATKAGQTGCVLKYATDEMEQSRILTTQGFFTLFPRRTVH